MEKSLSGERIDGQEVRKGTLSGMRELKYVSTHLRSHLCLTWAYVDNKARRQLK